mmetsp:Transcript_25730/g.59763  ORF Transcript_25730/g.59763 Transcript_25730/m.59763 type:complete len:237 (-) Transcript_25730:771-1481(-)
MSPPLSSTRRSKRRLPKDKGEKSNVEGTNTGKSRFHDNNKQQPSSSTSSTTASVARRPLVGASGRILSRTTWASLRLRRWQDGYWVHLFPASILLFHSFEEFDAWLHQSYGCPMFCLDFDTLGILEKQQQDDRADVVRPTLCHSKQSSKKLVARIQKLSMGPVHTKLYGNDLLYVPKTWRNSIVCVCTHVADCCVYSSHLPLGTHSKWNVGPTWVRMSWRHLLRPMPMKWLVYEEP